MTQTTTGNPSGPLRAVLTGLAASRGMTFAEVARESRKRGHPHTPRQLAEGDRPGYGDAIDDVLGLSEGERSRVLDAWWSEAEASATVPGDPGASEATETINPATATRSEEIPEYHYWRLRPYPEPRGAAEHKEPPRCVVSHPDAGGPCERAAVGEVWSLAFCGPHGREAEYAAMQETLEEADHELTALTNAERERSTRNGNVMDALSGATVPGLEGFAYDGEHHERLMREAYPPESSRVHPDTAIFDYDHHYAGDGPVDWWTGAREMVVRFMREAEARGLSVLRDELELIREQATAQQVIADDLYERHYVVPRTAEHQRRDPSAKILSAANRRLTAVVEGLEGLPGGIRSTEAISRAYQAVCEAGGIVAAEARKARDGGAA